MDDTLYDQYDDADLYAPQGQPVRPALRRQPLASTPSHGVEGPQPQPGASPLAQGPVPAPDYRARALAALDKSYTVGPSDEEKADANRKLMLALALSVKGGEAFQPFASALMKQAFVDPEAAMNRRAMRLETQARIYESMAASADTIEQRREAARQADATRR